MKTFDFAFLILLLLNSNFAVASTANGIKEIIVNPRPTSLCEMSLQRAFVQKPLYSYDPYGVINRSIEINSDSLYAAYSEAVFPWGSNKMLGKWCRPPYRGVLDLYNYKIDKRDAKQMPKLEERFQVTIDKDFAGVLENIAKQPRWAMDDNGKMVNINWLTDEMRSAWVKFHKEGHAHSFEAWENGVMVAGLYLTFVKGVATGESMFSLPGHAGARKLLLMRLADHMKAAGFRYIDIQQNHGLLKSWGAIDVPSEEYMTEYFRPAQARNLAFPTALQQQ